MEKLKSLMLEKSGLMERKFLVRVSTCLQRDGELRVNPIYSPRLRQEQVLFLE